MENAGAHNLDLILILAIGFTVALVFGYITHRLGWSSIVGYLLAGVLVGPYTPGFVANRHLAEQLSEVGVILLMFGVGLHFHLQDLLAVRRVAITGAVVQSATATALGAVVSHAFGWDWSAGIVFGLALSVASTAVLIRILSQNGALQSPTGRIAIGWLVVEDIFTVFVLVLLPAMFGAASDTSGLPMAILFATLKLIAFGVFMLKGGGRVVPWLFTKVAVTRSRELFTLSVLAVALGIAAMSSLFFGISMALGAFVAGMVVGQSEFSARAGSDALPMRDAFSVLFFLSVGMLFDPMQAFQAPLLIVKTLLIVMIGKPDRGCRNHVSARIWIAHVAWCSHRSCADRRVLVPGRDARTPVGCTPGRRDERDRCSSDRVNHAESDAVPEPRCHRRRSEALSRTLETIEPPS